MKKATIILLVTIVIISSFSCGPRRYKCGPYRRCEIKENSTKSINDKQINKIKVS